MLKLVQSMPILLLLIVATVLEVSGDATVRIALYERTGGARVAMMLAGAACLFGYGLFLNAAPLEFSRVVGLYIATLFVVWQVINFAVYRSGPPVPVLLGGVLIVAGGLIVSFWRVR